MADSISKRNAFINAGCKFAAKLYTVQK